MVRGGQREGAGRKSTWASGAKFEDTTVIRIPKNIKDKVSVVAHKLDAGEDIDLDSNSKIQELESKLSLIQSDNELLLNQLQNKSLDLETQSKKIQELKEENDQLRNSLNKFNQVDKQLVTNSNQEFNNLVAKSESHTQLGLLNQLDINESIKIRPLTSVELSRRFKKDDSFVKVKKNYYKDRPEKFFSELKRIDPNNISWVTVGQERKLRYIPADDTPIEKLEKLNKWMQANT